MKNVYAVIMAGGSGTRFWPASREDRPKQFLDILDIGQSLIQMTFDRMARLVPHDHIYVVADERYREITTQQLPDMPAQNFISEQGKKNTAPCVLLSALYLQARSTGGTMIITPADHYIRDEQKLSDALISGVETARTYDCLVTLGIQPEYPATGYGYIEMDSDQVDDDGGVPVRRFVEKPDQKTAETYLESGRFLWNSGMFIWNVDRIIEEFKSNAPDVYRELEPLTRDLSDLELLRTCYAAVPSISVDYAILEKAQNIRVITVDPGWSDLGTWNALHELMQQSGRQNPQETLTIDSPNCFTYSESGKKIVLYGVENMNVIEMNDVLLVLPKEKDQDIKKIFGKLRDFDSDLL